MDTIARQALGVRVVGNPKKDSFLAVGLFGHGFECDVFDLFNGAYKYIHELYNDILVGEMDKMGIAR